ncbi:hypothetical protein CASFOL_030538 [Castilleja foliolosa]|uniref:DUF1985 domain-containing protein n=1 Tax=Castilleja foliolosa TaxID=1961234 RepID=A0ABD3C7U3_9LAMI
MTSSDINNMAIDVYQPSLVGETSAANPTNAAANPTNSANANSANAADLSTTISDDQNTDAVSTIGLKWMWPTVRNPEGKKTSILLDVKTDYPKNQVPGTVIHLMLRQQVIKEGTDEDELWFLVGDKFVRFSKYEYALVTGLRFGPTDFDSNADCDIPTEGVYRTFIDPQNEFKKNGAKYTSVLFVHGFFVSIDKRYRIANWLWALVEETEKWETFPWGAYLFQILMYRMKNAKVKAGFTGDNYHIYGLSHAFLHFIFEVVPGLADKLTLKPKHNCVQPRLLKRLCHTKPLKEYLKFFDSQDIQCFDKLEPTKQELIDYTWWHHVADDVRSSVRYIHRESNKTKKALLLKRTREQARTMESPNVYSGELLTRILEGVRRENELCMQRVMRELQRHNNYVPFEEKKFNFEPSSPTGQSPPPPPKTKTPSPPPVINPPSPLVQTTAQTTTQTTEQKTEQTKTRTPERKTPPPPPSTDDLYVPFDGNFIDDIEAFADKTDYVRRRGDQEEPEFTPIERLPIRILEYLTPIKVPRVSVKKAQSNNKFITIRRAVRPPKDSEFDTYMNSKHMKAYNAYLESGSKEKRDCGTGMFQ